MNIFLSTIQEKDILDFKITSAQEKIHYHLRPIWLSSFIEDNSLKF